MPPGIVASEAEKREQPVWRLLLARPAFLTGAAILLFWIVCAFFGTAIAPHNPLAQQLLAANASPSAAHWFGTDQLGRDMFSRVIAGAQTILIIAPLATLVGTVLGTALGLALGYLGGIVDMLVGRVVETVLALPVIVVAFLFVVALGASTLTQILIIGFIFTPLIARTVRSAVQVEGQAALAEGDDGRCGGRRRRLRPAQDGHDPGDHLARTERLDQVIVSADIESGDAIIFALARGQHQNGRIGPGANAPADLHTIEGRKHQIQNNQIGMFAGV